MVKRVGDVVASTAGGTVGPTVAAMMTSAAIATKNPTLLAMAVPGGAFADALTEQGIQLVTRTFFDPAERVQRLADAVADECGQPTEAFIAEHVKEPTQRQLMGAVVDAATDARSDWKIRLLARAFVRGVKDGDLVDETEMFVKATRMFEPPHARVLAAAIQAMRGNHTFVNTQALMASTKASVLRHRCSGVS